MKKRFFWLILSCTLVLSMLLASCGTKTTQTTASTSVPTTKQTTTAITSPTTTLTTTQPEKPQYGGTINSRITADPNSFDAYTGGWHLISLAMDSLTMRDPTVDPKIWFHNMKIAPSEYNKGLLAESWEQADPTTIIFHIRKSVRWQDKPPMNGREFTAYDVEFHYQRLTGLGSGYTKPNPQVALGVPLQTLLVSVTATDKYTIVFKAKKPSLQLLEELADPLPIYVHIVPPEAVKMYGDVNDWRHTVGTGPFFLDDYVSGAVVAFKRNPNYFDYDEFYPENRLPYADLVKLMIIPDNATAYAALRTGKIDLIDNIQWNQAASFKKTNPDLLQTNRPYDGFGLGMRVDKAPFTDIRVRRAMQMAMDLKTIAATQYGGLFKTQYGLEEGTPVGLMSPALKDYYMPYNEWESEVKDWYAYNPQKARALLAEAGYPNGFKTNMVVRSTDDLDLCQILKAYLLEIGVDMEIRAMEPLAYSAFTKAMKHDAFCPTFSGSCQSPTFVVTWRYSTQASRNIYGIKDPVFDEMCDKAMAATSKDEFKRLNKEIDYYSIKQQWVVNLVPTVLYCVYQPWFKGFKGWTELRGAEYARFWIAQDLKNKIGS